MSDTDRLWGGTLSGVCLDPTWTMSLRVTTLYDGVAEAWDLLLSDVASIRADRRTPLPWNYADLTEVHVVNTPDGVEVELVLWSEDSTITVTASSVAVVALDARVEGAGDGQAPSDQT